MMGGNWCGYKGQATIDTQVLAFGFDKGTIFTRMPVVNAKANRMICLDLIQTKVLFIDVKLIKFNVVTYAVMVSEFQTLLHQDLQD